jgi:hypothetical protein
MNFEFRPIAASVLFLVLSPILVPLFNLDLAPLVYAVIGISGLVILSAGLAGIMKS